MNKIITLQQIKTILRKTMKKLILLFLLTLNFVFGYSNNYNPVDDEEKGKDTIKTLNLDEFVITSSVKETNAPRQTSRIFDIFEWNGAKLFCARLWI